jgi:signal transduction histidine kinase
LALASFEIAIVLAMLICGVAIFAFGSYVRSIESELDTTLAQLGQTFSGIAVSPDARPAGQMIAARFLRSDVVVVLIDAQRRVAVFRRRRTDPQATIEIRAPGDAASDPAASGPFAQPILGLATAFGLRPERLRIGSLTIIVKESDAALSATAGAFALPFFLTLFFAILVAHVVARILTRQILQPLVDVTVALERFAAGDLTPQPIAVDSRQDFGSLALAYNGAIAQMERAFAERERVNAAMRQFITDAGHQLRTPLTVIRGFIAILRKGGLRTLEDREHILETMNRQSQIMGSLIEKLMLLESWDRHDAALPVEPIDIAQLVADVVAPIAEAISGRILRVDAQTGLLVSIDPSDFAHALTNLVDNALKYTNGEIDVRVYSDAENVVIEVCDRGPGMSSDEVRHAFDRFYRGARRDVEGSGLGLSIAKRAIERAHGTLDFITDPDAGSVFTIRLPRAQLRRREPTIR